MKWEIFLFRHRRFFKKFGVSLNHKNHSKVLDALTSLVKVAQDPDTPPDELLRLSQHFYKDIHQAVAANPSTPPTALARLAATTDIDVACTVARNLATPEESLLHLAKSASWEVQRHLVRNPNVTQKLLNQFADLKDYSLLLRFAENPRLKPDLISHLLDLDSPMKLHLRCCIARNPATPLAVLRRLVSENHLMADLVAFHPKADLGLITEAVESEYEHIRRSVLLSPNVSPELALKLMADGVYPDRKDIAALLDRLSLQDIYTLSGFASLDLKRAIIRSDIAQEDTLELLSKDGHRAIRREVALSLKTPPQLLVRLAHDRNKHVRAGVAANSNTSPPLLAELAKDRRWRVRAEVAQREDCPPEALKALAHDVLFWVRIRVAANTRTSSEVLKMLQNDPVEVVRFAAQRHSCRLENMDSVRMDPR
jgi:hypothetical protein